MNALQARKLSGALHHIAVTLLELEQPNRSTVIDSALLIRTLARIVEGAQVVEAFGAPGDWGYNTPIGKTLNEILSS